MSIASKAQAHTYNYVTIHVIKSKSLIPIRKLKKKKFTQLGKYHSNPKSWDAKVHLCMLQMTPLTYLGKYGNIHKWKLESPIHATADMYLKQCRT